MVETKVASLEQTGRDILKKLDEVDHKLTKQKGFLGGIIFLVMCIATALGLAKDYLIHGLLR